MESKLYEQILKEATYNWEIDPIDRSWFVMPDGKLHSDVSHRFIMKRLFPDEWKQLRLRGMEDADIDPIFEKRIIQSGGVKIGELGAFYSIVSKLGNREKDALQGFCKSFLKVRNEPNALISIEETTTSRTIRATLRDIAEDYLYEK